MKEGLILALVLSLLLSTSCKKSYEHRVVKADYDLYVHNDTIWLLEGDRLVGDMRFGQNPVLDSIIIQDNQ